VPNKIEIIINDKASSQDQKKTAAFPRRRPFQLGRRRLQTRKKYLRVFDFARTAAGGDIPFLFGEDTVLEDPIFIPSGPSGSVEVTLNPVNHLSEWNSQLLSVDEEEWHETYRDITQTLGSEYDISIDGIGGFVAGKGLEIPEGITGLKGTTGATTELEWIMKDETTGISTQPYFPFWLDRTVTGAAPYKITKLPSYSADEEILTIDKSIDVFLSPMIFGTSARGRDFPLADSSYPYSPQTWYYAGIGLMSVPRSTIGNSDWDAIWTASHTGFGALSQPIKEYAVSLFINNGSIPMWTLNATSTLHPASTPITDVTQSVAGFPLEASGVQNGFFVNSSLSAGYHEGMLMGAVRKHLGNDTYEWYYIWNSDFWQGLNRPFIIGGTPV
jgi:hypothetical protein